MAAYIFAMVAITGFASPGIFAPTLGVLYASYIFFTWAEYRSIPGPVLASVTNIVHLYWIWRNHPFEKYYELYQQYSRLVRIGPDVISVLYPAEIPNI